MLPISTQLGTAWLGYDQVGNREYVKPIPAVTLLNQVQLTFVTLPSPRPRALKGI